MGRFEGALARTQELDPHAPEHAARLERKKLAMRKAQEAQEATREAQAQRDRTEYLLKSPDRFVMLSQNELALAESLLPDFEKKPTKKVIDQLKEVQRELLFIQDHADVANKTPEMTAVMKRCEKTLGEIEAVVGPAFHVEETGSMLAILHRKFQELEGMPLTPGRSEYVGPHRTRKSPSHKHEPKVILSEEHYKNPFAN